jgi:hypothetical protein
MAFNDDELNQLELVVIKAVNPIKTDIALINQTLVGKSGLVDKVECLEKKVIDLKIFKKQVYAVVGSIQLVGAAIMTWLKLSK